MNVGKLEEILNSLKDKNVEVMLDTYKLCDEPKPNATYDLTSVSIECKNKTTLHLGFEERVDKNVFNKEDCRMKNMNIKILDEDIQQEDDNE